MIITNKRIKPPIPPTIPAMRPTLVPSDYGLSNEVSGLN